MSKYIFVTGGVVSGLGKGITVASLGNLLKSRGYKIFVQKFDPYLNIDPGTLSPYEHGEVFVTEDGAETDLDLGHYERFINTDLTKLSNITTGRIYSDVLEKERQGAFLGNTVQVVPHITDALKKKIYLAAEESKADFIITEIGGTVGDIESYPFLEAIRQVGAEQKDNVCYVHLVLVPYLRKAGELKSKPAQHSYKELMKAGIIPDFMVVRSETGINEKIREKISLFCNIDKTRVIDAKDAETIYDIPINFYNQKFDRYILDKFKMESNKIYLKPWNDFLEKAHNLNKTLTIGIVGKYVVLEDAYLSVTEAVKHAGINEQVKVKIKWILSEEITNKNVRTKLKGVDGVIVPGGFGNRGIEGKINAIKYIRENNIPFLGICLGMQLATIEYARNVVGMPEANSTEFDEKTKEPLFAYLPDQYKGINLGGTMRLGAYNCNLIKGTLAYRLYNEKIVSERHRHRYEFNNKYQKRLEDKGLVFSGINPETNLVEIIELKNHPYFIGSQFHPEFKSRPIAPRPLFEGLIKAALKYKNKA